MALTKVTNDMLVGPLGSGGGAVNLIENGDADGASASIFTAYEDAVTSRPVDGAGGSPTVTTSITTVNPLTGTKSFLLTKPASNVRGQGWSILTTNLDQSYRAKSLKVSFDYLVNSGTFVAGSNSTEGDLIVYFYDITNAKIVEPMNIKLFSNSTTVSDRYESTIQFDSNCTQFRMIIHCASTSNLAYELKLDNISVSPSNYVYGTPITEWKSFVPTFTGFGTVTSVSAYWRRVGENLEVYGRATSGTSIASVATIIFAALGVNINTSKIITDTTKGQTVGEFQRETAGSASFSIGVQSNFTNYVYISDSATQGGLRDSDGNAILGSNEKFSFKFSVPILGWSASTQTSDSYDARKVAARYSTASTTAITSTLAAITYGTRAFDYTASMSGSSWTVPTADLYRIGGSVQLASSTWTTGKLELSLFKNGVLESVIASFTQAAATSTSATITAIGSTLVQLNAGDVLTFRVSQTQTASINLSGDASYNYITIEKSSGTQTISANEKTYASYSCTTGQSIPNNTSTIVLFNSKIEDTHGTYNTSNGRLTLNRAGVGYINATIGFSTAAATTYYVQIFKNGSVYKSGVSITATTWGASFSGLISGVAGDYFEIKISQSSGAAKALDMAGANNHFDFRME